MGRETTKTVALRPETKALLEEKTPDGVDYDYFIKHAIQHAPDLASGVE